MIGVITTSNALELARSCRAKAEMLSKLIHDRPEFQEFPAEDKLKISIGFNVLMENSGCLAEYLQPTEAETPKAEINPIDEWRHNYPSVSVASLQPIAALLECIQAAAQENQNVSITTIQIAVDTVATKLIELIGEAEDR